MESDQTRILLWTCSRSLSTAFYRAITNAPDTLGIFEPYFEANPYGGDVQITDDVTSRKQFGSLFKDIKAKLEQPYTDYKTIFVKVLAFRFMVSPYMIKDVIPEGYVHTFLIRDPHKTITSMYIMFEKKEIKGWTTFDVSYGETKQLYELYTYLTNELDMKCLVVDADDLLEGPEAVLAQYCEFVGIPFHESMIRWDLADASRVEAFRHVTNAFRGTFFDNAVDSVTFQKPVKRAVDLSAYPPIVKEAIEEHMPYYELLWKKRVVI